MKLAPASPRRAGDSAALPGRIAGTLPPHRAAWGRKIFSRFRARSGRWLRIVYVKVVAHRRGKVMRGPVPAPGRRLRVGGLGLPGRATSPAQARGCLLDPATHSAPARCHLLDHTTNTAPARCHLLDPATHPAPVRCHLLDLATHTAPVQDASEYKSMQAFAPNSLIFTLPRHQTSTQRINHAHQTPAPHR